MAVFLLAINHDFSVNVLVYKMWKELIIILVLICVSLTKKKTLTSHIAYKKQHIHANDKLEKA